jgi:hypothetical protein
MSKDIMKQLFVAVTALSLAGTPALAQYVAASSNKNYVAIPNYNANGGLPHWQACRQAVINNTADCNVLIIGESTSIGHASFYNEDASDAHSGATANQLANILRAYHVNAQTNSISGNQNTVASAAYGSFDTRATINGWCQANTTGFSYTFGGYHWLACDTTAFTFNLTDPSYQALATTPVKTDTLDVYYLGEGGGTLTVDTGGSPICSINTSSASPTFNKTSCSTTLAANTYNLKCSTAFTCFWNTIVARNSAIKQVSIINGAFDSATVEQYTTATSITGCTSGCPWDPLPVIKQFAPALCIVMDIGNDQQNNTPIPTYTSNLTNIVNACKSSGDVLLMTGFPSTLPGPPGGSPYVAAALGVASATNSPVWDTIAAYGGYTDTVSGWYSMGMNAGWNGVNNGGTPETAHWSSASNVYQATILSMILLQ